MNWKEGVRRIERVLFYIATAFVVLGSIHASFVLFGYPTGEKDFGFFCIFVGSFWLLVCWVVRGFIK